MRPECNSETSANVAYQRLVPDDRLSVPGGFSPLGKALTDFGIACDLDPPEAYAIHWKPWGQVDTRRVLGNPDL